MTLLKLDNENYKEESNDIFPIEYYESNQTSNKYLEQKTIRSNSKQNKVLSKLNYNRLKEIKLKQKRSVNNKLHNETKILNADFNINEKTIRRSHNE